MWLLVSLSDGMPQRLIPRNLVGYNDYLYFRNKAPTSPFSRDKIFFRYYLVSLLHRNSLPWRRGFLLHRRMGGNGMKEHICMCRWPQDICIRLMSGDLIKSITDHLTAIVQELCTAGTGTAFFIHTNAFLSR